MNLLSNYIRYQNTAVKRAELECHELRFKFSSANHCYYLDNVKLPQELYDSHTHEIINPRPSTAGTSGNSSSLKLSNMTHTKNSRPQSAHKSKKDFELERIVNKIDSRKGCNIWSAEKLNKLIDNTFSS